MLALGDSFQKVRRARWQVTTDTLCLMFQARGKPPRSLAGRGWPRPLPPTPRVAPRQPHSLAHCLSQAGESGGSPGVSAKAGRYLAELTQGPSAEGGVNRLSLKVTSSGSGSGDRRKLQSFFRAVNAKRKTH